MSSKKSWITLSRPFHLDHFLFVNTASEFQEERQNVVFIESNRIQIKQLTMLATGWEYLLVAA
jgi:hypothetical protein